MNKQTTKTWLPIFEGFYNTNFDQYYNLDAEYLLGDMSEDSKEKQEYYYQHVWDFIDYKQNKIDISILCCDMVSDRLKEIGFDNTIEYETINSPKEYNFSNDSINCAISIDLHKIIEYCNKNLESFEIYIKEKYTSRSGFWSSYPNDVDYWLDINYIGEHELGSILQFIITNEDKASENNEDHTRDNIVEIMYDSIQPSEYVEYDKLEASYADSLIEA